MLFYTNSFITAGPNNNNNSNNHHPHHVTINNGVKVINSTDLINHSRTFIVKYIVEKLQFPCGREN